MKNIDERIAALSPEQKALLELRLKQRNTKSKSLVSIPKRQAENVLSLSFSQERFWILHQLQPDVPFYNEVKCFQLSGNLNIAALEKSLQEIVQRHEVLRTKFVTLEGRPIQVIEPIESFSLPIIDLSDLPESDRQSQALELATQIARQPFDIAQETLCRIKLIHLSPQEHVLLFTAHHIVFDGWSMGVFIRELTALYAAFCTGKPSQLPNLHIQYADFAIWQRQWLQGNIIETQLAYWKQQLGGTLPVLELPTNLSHSQSENIHGANQFLQLSPALTQALKNLSQQQGATLFMTLLAVFKVLLYRYTNVTDILVGSPIANRNRAELEGLIGLFINTLVLRTDLSGNPTFASLLKRVQEVALNAYAHQDLPFEKLVEELQPERNFSQSPLFQVMFIHNNSPMPALELPGLNVSPLAIDNGTAVFDLTLLVSETAGYLNVVCEYNADWFDAATITRMLGHWQTLLEGVVENPQQQIGQLPLLTPSEKNQLLLDWNNTNRQWEILASQPDLCIHQIIAAQAEQTPEAIAVVYENQQLTYSQLNQRANQLAHYLQFLGVQPEVLVGISIDCSLEMIVGILGILKAGGAYVPLDPAYPQERLAFMLADAQVSVLLTQEHLLAKLPATQAKVICLNTDWEAIQQYSTTNPQTLSLNESNLAYVIYTSGSTSQPKGVMVTHSSLVNAYYAWNEAYELSCLSSHLQMASFSFDVFAGNLVRALCSGSKLVLCPREILLSPAELYQLMRVQQIDCAEFVPAVLRSLRAYLEQTKQSLDFMKLLIVGSDSWYLQEHEAIRRFCGTDTRLINSYGLTEATIDSTYFAGETSNLVVENLVPIGRPFANSQAYILDQNLQLLPIGVAGELYIGGAGVARGYLNRPELTAQKFIPHPFSEEQSPVTSQQSSVISQQSPRIYKTGDLARFLADGNIEYLGRSDYQVKIRGFRVELGEIEAAISRHQTVQETVVLVREDEPGDKRLVAYIVPTQKENISVSELRQVLKRKLPNQMIPSAFVVIDALPLTPNGKIDRRALPKPENVRPELDANVVAPQNSVEAILVKIWSEVLGVKQVGIYDNFFELGGDSILSIQVVAKSNQQGLRLTPKQLFQYQTIAELAAVVDTSQLILAEQGIVSGSVPLTPIQHWFFQQNLQNPHHWNQSILLEVRQDINYQLLEKAIKQLLIHHDALRLKFISNIDGWQQINTTPDPNIPLCQIDLSMLAENEQAEAIETTANQLQASLNIFQGSLVKVALFDLGDRKSNLLLIVIHHLAVDGVSWRILLEDLQTVYQQLCHNQSISLPAKTTSFQQWSEKLQKYAQSEQIQQELEFWLHQLPKHISQLPRDYPDGSNTVAASQTIVTTLNVAETQALLQEVPTAYRTQINDVLLTALVQAFAEFTGQSSLLIDLEGHGREDIFEDVDLSRTVGWFTSVFPVFLTINETATLGEALQTIKEQLRQIPNRGISYGLLRYLSQNSDSRQLQLLPQAEISFNYLGQVDGSFSPSSMFSLAKESSGSVYSLEDNRAYLLEIDGLITNGQLEMVWKYSTQIYKSSTIESLAQNFREKLRSLITHCQSPEAGGYTPSDFPFAQLCQEELNAALANVEFG